MSESPVSQPEKGEKSDESPSQNEEKTVVDSKLGDQKIQKIIQEAIIIAGGAAAILLQVAEPGVAKGVHTHSNFAYRPMDRLRTTMTYVYCMTCGSETERQAVVKMVHQAHSSVKSSDYSADDPELQLWVAATLYSVGVEIYERIFGALSPEESEQIYSEYSILATSLRVPASLWPENRQAFGKYWEQKIETVQITHEAKQVAQDLLRNKKLPLHIRAALPFVRLVTSEMLPKRIRDEYGLKSSRLRTGTYRFIIGTTKVTYPHLPRWVRTYPMKYYLKDMRRRLNDMA